MDDLKKVVGAVDQVLINEAEDNALLKCNVCGKLKDLKTASELSCECGSRAWTVVG